MKRLRYFLCLLVVAGLASAGAQTYQPDWASLDKRPTPAWFTNAKFGIIIHWGVYSVPGYAPVLPGKLAYAEWYWHNMAEGRDNPKANETEKGTWAYHQRVYGADFPYRSFAKDFKAQLFNPDQWADILAGSGAKYVILTSKHHDGFALWPSKQASADWGRPWNAVDTGPKRDVLGELSEAVRRKGVKMGYYYSLYEWYNPLYLTDKQRYIREHMFPQFKDLVTRYKPAIIFSDGEWDLTSSQWHTPELLAWLFNESPVKDTVVINDRWGSETRHKDGGYWTTEYTAGMSDMSHPWEESRGMGFSYGYNRDESLKDYHTGRELVIMLVDIVSRGGNFLLDIGPKADGTIPPIMQDRLQQIGSWLKINGDAIYGTHPWKTTRQWSAGQVPEFKYNQRFSSAYNVAELAGKPQPGMASIEAFFTAKGDDLYAILPRWPGRSFVLKDVNGVKAVSLLGSDGQVKFHSRRGGVAISLPELPESLLGQPAWVLKVSR
jgi:alpha-L-fucosidase